MTGCQNSPQPIANEAQKHFPTREKPKTLSKITIAIKIQIQTEIKDFPKFRSRDVPIESEIMSRSGFGLTFMPSTMALMGLLVRCETIEGATCHSVEPDDIAAGDWKRKRRKERRFESVRRRRKQKNRRKKKKEGEGELGGDFILFLCEIGQGKERRKRKKERRKKGERR